MTPPRIVYLEDEPIVAEPVRLLLEQEGYRVVTTQTVREFLIRLLEEQTDVAILDLHLKDGSSGLDCCRWMRRRPRFEQTPVLILTNDSQRKTVLEALTSGASDYLLKAQFRAATLLKRIEKLARRKGEKGPTETSVCPTPRTTEPSEEDERRRPNPVDHRALRKDLEKLSDLKALPFVATEVVQLARTGEAGTRQLVETISRDPALAAKVLRIANSVVYGARGGVQDLTRALLNIGSRGLVQLVLGMSVVELFTEKKGPFGLDRLAFWKHSLATGVLARQLAVAIDYPDSEEAFISGLLHDLGKPILEELRPTVYQKVLRRVREEKMELTRAEQETFRCDHSRAAREVAERWKLPRPLVLAMSNHHCASEQEGAPSDRESALVALVAVANSLAKALGLGASGNPYLTEPDPALVEAIGLQSELVDKLLEQSRHEIDDLQTVFWMHASEAQLRKEGSPPAAPGNVKPSVMLFGKPEAVALSPFRLLCRRWGGLMQTTDLSESPSPPPGRLRPVCLGRPLSPSMSCEASFALRGGPEGYEGRARGAQQQGRRREPVPALPEAPHPADDTLFVLPASVAAPVGAKGVLRSPYHPDEVLEWLRNGGAAR